MGLASQEQLTGKIEEENKSPKFVYGRSYCISISPSQKNYELTKKKMLLSTHNLLSKKKDEFKIEDQYNSVADLHKVLYKKVWHPVFCQSATLSKLGNYIYLIGGVSHTIVQQI